VTDYTSYGWYPTEPIRSGLQIVSPAAPVLTVGDAKAHCRIDGSADDASVAQWIAAATRKVEADTERALLTQTWRLGLDRFPSFRGAIDLPLRPVLSVTSILYFDSNNDGSTLDGLNYIVDSIGHRIGLTPIGSWPTDLRSFAPIQILFTCGAATPEEIPENLLHAVRLAVAWFSENREPTKAETTSYDALIAPFVVPAIG
jgi:uncharacterized phiE125 gp8 family phage protein